MTRFPDANSSSLFASWRPAVATCTRATGTYALRLVPEYPANLCLMNYPQAEISGALPFSRDGYARDAMQAIRPLGEFMPAFVQDNIFLEGK